jgi:plasmid stabilization system protein ParE
MNYPLVITPEAEADMQQASQWYESQRVGLGADFLDRVEKVLDRITFSPEIHAVAYRNVRQTLVRKFPYVVCYILEQDRVDVIAVFHVRRDPSSWQSRAGQ